MFVHNSTKENYSNDSKPKFTAIAFKFPRKNILYKSVRLRFFIHI